MTWTIAVKTVGSGKSTKRQEQQISTSNKQSSENDEIALMKSDASESFGGKAQPKDFTINVDPELPLTALYDKIEQITGLKSSQQRLIYRGRLITKPGESEGETETAATSCLRINEIEGLKDGQTIHLVPRPINNIETTSTASSPNLNASASIEESTENSPSAIIGGNSTASLLATLLGLGTSNAFSTMTTAGGTESEDELRERRRSQQHRRIRRTLQRSQGVPARTDPGSLEPCRQGLMTIHTLLNHNQSNERKWFKGQWLDCRDTVNQWLEATVVDIVTPQDILTPAELQTALDLSTRRQKRMLRFDADPIINANDYDGRRRLLLDFNESGDAKLRDGTNVQLLLIHYNGWPHRWDEWIRSDSERIRPFRTRTRHATTAPYASPTPQYVFQASPSTYILNDDQSDRSLILPELSRTLSSVNTLLQSIAALSPNSSTQTHLPWLTGEQDSPQLDQQQLKALAPLLDRLGRTLTDIAPHVASLATSNTESTPSDALDPNDSSTNVASRHSPTRASAITQPNEETNPEMIDYVHGMVNAAGRENRRDNVLSSARDVGANSNTPSNAEAGRGLLGSIFSASGDDAGALNRLLRVNSNGSEGGGSGGIDIHIHAIVTPTPGLAMFGATPATGLGFAMQPTPAFRARSTDDLPGNADENHESPTNIASSITIQDDDELGLFSDLYTANPPISGTVQNRTSTISSTSDLDELPPLEPRFLTPEVTSVQPEEVVPLIEDVLPSLAVNRTLPQSQPLNEQVSSNIIDSGTSESNTFAIPTSQGSNSSVVSSRGEESTSSSTTRRVSSTFGRILRRALGRGNRDEDD